MSTFVNIDSVCGNASTSIDIFDLDANPDGVVCCDHCKSILICRNAWNFLYRKYKQDRRNKKLRFWPRGACG